MITEGTPQRPFQVRRRVVYRVSIVTLTSLAAQLGAQDAPALAPATAVRVVPPRYLREIYVPHAELKALVEKDRDGVVMSLEEYRALVLKGALRPPEPPPPELPPLGSVAAAAEHHAVLEGKTARIRSTLRVDVVEAGWMRCDLGPVIEHLGSILVDGEPGWILIAEVAGPPPAAGAQAAQTAKVEGDAAAQAAANASPPPTVVRRSHLLLRGPGEHRVEIEFSLAASESQDRWTLAGPVPSAAAARLRLEVEGLAEGTAAPAFLETSYDPARQATRFELALGNSESFTLSWRRRRAVGEVDALLGAEHRVSVLARRAQPAFSWLARITVARRKAEVLEFDEGAGMRVLQVRGSHVQSWERREGVLRVVLTEAVLGVLDVAFEGLIEGQDEADGVRFRLGAPSLRRAYSSSGYLAVLVAAPECIEVLAVEGLREIAPGDAEVPALAGRAVDRLYSFAAAPARLELRASARAARFELRGAVRLDVGEKRAGLDAVYQAQVLHGRLYELRLSLPEPWQLVQVEALQPPGSAAAEGAGAWKLRHEVEGAAASRELVLRVERAVEPGRSLRVRILLEHGAWGAEPRPDEREVRLQVPSAAAAERVRVDLAAFVAPSMYAEFLVPAGWRALRREDLEELGLAGHGLEEGLVAGLSTTSARDPVALTLHRLPERGECHTLSYLLALEDRVRVRTELRLGVVDRPLEELVLLVSVPADIKVHVAGDGVQEVAVAAADAGSSTHRLRFSRPWIGERRLRLEYEAAYADLPALGGRRAVPWLEVQGGFHVERTVLFQSLGPVEVDVEPGPALVVADADELPELGEPWPEGRVLFAYRYLRRSSPASYGSFLARVHPRASVLASIVRELDLTTVLGASGVSRTVAEAVLAYTQQPFLEVRLPADARLLSVELDSEPASRVRPGTERGEWRLPLPARSYVRLRFVYERPDREGGAAGGDPPPLGAWGSWSEEGPVFAGIPAGACRWRFYHPEGYRVFLRGGNLLAVEPRHEERVTSFAASFFGRLLSGRLPVFTCLTDESDPRPRAAAESARAAAAQGPSPAPSPPQTSPPQSREASQQQQRLRAQAFSNAAPASSQAAGASATPTLSVAAEGALLDARKTGGEPRLVVDYRDFAWWRFAKRAVALLTVVAGVALALRAGRRTLWRFVLWGLCFGTLVPYVLEWLAGWESPFLAIPFCEGLVFLLLGGGAWELGRWMRARRVSSAGAGSLVLLVLGLACGAIASRGLEAQAPPNVAPTPLKPAPVVIGYELDALGLGFSPARSWSSVYLPHATFRQVWLRAHPEDEKSIETPPADVVLANALYDLEVEGDAFRLRGKVWALVLSEDWVSLALPFGESQLESVRVDGEPAGAAQKDGAPVLALKGKGRREIEVSVRGPVLSEPGLHALKSPLLRAPSTRVRARLPSGARLEQSSGAVSAGGGPAPAVFDVDAGGSGRIELAWSFPRIEGATASQLEPSSYSLLELGLDGYSVERDERLRVTGRPVASVRYRILGDWRVAEVAAAELSEWSVAESGGAQSLQVFFSRPVHEARLAVRGRARLGAEPAGLAALALEGAVRQEGFVGLRHGERRRWHPGALSVLLPASIPEVGASFELRAGREPDRVYQTFQSGEGLSVSAVDVSSRVSLESDAVLFAGEDRAVLTVRSRYRVATPPGPMRQEVVLPGPWKVRSASGSTLRRWEAQAEGESVRLVILLAVRAVTDTEIVWTAELEYGSVPSPLRLPLLKTETADQPLREETIRVAVAASAGLELSALESSGLVRVPLEGAATWVGLPPGAAYRLAFRSTGTRPQYALALQPLAPRADLRATAVLAAWPAEDFVHVNSRVLLRVRSGAVDRFRLVFPPQAEVTSLETPNLKGRTPLDGGAIEVALVSPLAGEQAVDLAYRVPRPGEAAPVVLRPLRVLGAQGEALEGFDQYVAVLQSAQTLTAGQKRANLDEVPVSSLPYVPQGVAARSLRPVYRAGAADWSLELRPEAVVASEKLSALVELAEVSTTLSSDGTLRSRAVFTLHNRSLQFLRVALPPGAELWGVTIAGRAVLASREMEAAEGTAGGGGGPLEGWTVLKVPLERVGTGDLDLEVAVVYEEPRLEMPGVRRALGLRAPRVLDTKVRRSLWRVELPEGYQVAMRDGNMREADESLGYASKVESLLAQIDRVAKVVEGAEAAGAPERVQRRAAGNLVQLQQALSDNVMDLERTLQRDQADERRQEDAGEMRRQQAFSQDLLRRGRQTQTKLGAELKEKEARERGQVRGAKEQAFEDNFRFLGNSWQANDPAAGAAEERGPKGGAARAPDSGEGAAKADLKRLVDPEPFSGLRGLESSQAAHVPSEPQAGAVAAGGLAPLPAATATPPSPVLETPPGPESPRMLTFDRPEGDAEIELVVTRQGVAPRFVALVLLVALLGALGWRGWRRM
jgi:hypothetical protein